MSNYIGKTCPFCKTILNEGDEAVVCSACDMPHHKDCWVENQGCTTFGCLGTINSPNAYQPNMQSFEFKREDVLINTRSVFCTKCGFENRRQSVFCTSCGNQLRKNQ